MTYILIGIIVLLFLAHVAQEHSRAVERREWASERTDLLNRIQAPERSVFASLAPEWKELPPMEPDQTNMVGRVIPLNPENKDSNS